MSDPTIYLIFVSLGGTTVEKLSEESGQKQLHAYYKACKCQIEQRLVYHLPQRQSYALQVEFDGYEIYGYPPADEEH